MQIQFRTEEERTTALSQRETEKILGVNPTYASVADSLFFDNYDLPCPVRVSVQRKDGGVEIVVLRKPRHGSIHREVAMLNALAEFGLPVPQVLAAPFENENGEWCAVYSLLPGENLQKLSSGSQEGLQEAKVLLVNAVQQLAAAGDYISQRDEFKDLPRVALRDELESVQDSSNNGWLRDPLYQMAIQDIAPRLKEITTPLVLSNGDYQPGNFLAKDGKITGFLDFESPSFQDPMMGFVKYPIYDLIPLSRTDMIDAFLKSQEFTRKEFSLRLVIGCLKIMKKEIDPEGRDESMREYRLRVASLLKGELEKLSDGLFPA